VMPAFSSLWRSMSFFGLWILLYSSIPSLSISTFWPIKALPAARRCSGTSNADDYLGAPYSFISFLVLPELKILVNSSSYAWTSSYFCFCLWMSYYSNICAICSLTSGGI
jgi:hypothetical protein